MTASANISSSRQFRLSIAGSALCGALLAALALFMRALQVSLLEQLAVFLSLAPLAGFLVALTLPAIQQRIAAGWRKSCRCPLLIAAGLACSYSLAAIGNGFNPYDWLVVILFFILVLLSAHALSQCPPGYSDMLLLWVLLVPFEYRLTEKLWFGAQGISYIWWSLALSVLMIVIWRDGRGLPGMAISFVLKAKDIMAVLLVTAVALLFLLPMAMALDFIRYNPPADFIAWETAVRFIGLLFTVAIPEELFFRGVLMMSLLALTKKLWLAVLLSSLFFGLCHWNNATTLQQQLAYCFLASIAGIFYALSYLRCANNLLPAALTHTAIDWGWQLFFK